MITTIPPFPALSDRADNSYNSKAFNWASHMANVFPGEVNALAANLNSIAAGGAYALPYVYAPYSEIGNSPGGKVYLLPSGAGTQSGSTTLYVDTKNAAGTGISTLLSSFTQSSSSFKGQIRLQKAGDVSRWAVFNVIAVAGGNELYKSFQIDPVGSSSDVPFGNGDLVMLFFQRTGDKGDTGAAAINPSAKFSDQKAGGQLGGVSAYNTIQVRTLNTTVHNSIPGLTLSGSQLTFAIGGTFDITGRAPACGVNKHKASLYNATDGAYAIVGASAHSGSGDATQTDSIFDNRITIAAGKVFDIRHFTGDGSSQGSAALGIPSSVAGQPEVYTEIIITKVSA